MVGAPCGGYCVVGAPCGDYCVVGAPCGGSLYGRCIVWWLLCGSFTVC